MARPLSGRLNDQAITGHRPPSPVTGRRHLSPVADHVSEHTVERARDAGEIDGIGKQPAVPVLPAGSASEEAVQLVVRAASALGGLSLQDPERPQLALRIDDPFHLIGAESVDQFVFQIGGASEEPELLQARVGIPRAETGPLEAAPEASFFRGVIKTCQPDAEAAWTIAVKEMADVRRAFHGQNADPLGVQVTATPLGQRLQGIPVTQSFDKDDRICVSITGRCRRFAHRGPPPRLSN
jgi:hypothetical protein